MFDNSHRLSFVQCFMRRKVKVSKWWSENWNVETWVSTGRIFILKLLRMNIYTCIAEITSSRSSGPGGMLGHFAPNLLFDLCWSTVQSHVVMYPRNFSCPTSTILKLTCRFKRRQAETSNIDLFILANKCAMDDFKGRVGWVCLLSSVRILVLGNYGISFDVWSSCVDRLHLIWFSWRLHVAAGHFEAEPEAASVRAPVASPGAAASLCFGIKRLILRGNSSLLSLLQIRH